MKDNLKETFNTALDSEKEFSIKIGIIKEMLEYAFLSRPELSGEVEIDYTPVTKTVFFRVVAGDKNVKIPIIFYSSYVKTPDLPSFKDAIRHVLRRALCDIGLIGIIEIYEIAVDQHKKYVYEKNSNNNNGL